MLPTSYNIGTHFFQDLVETKIYSLAISQEEPADRLNLEFIRQAADQLPKFFPAPTPANRCIKLIHIPTERPGCLLEIAMDAFEILSELRRIYGNESALPVSHYAELCRQIEAQTSQYETVEETVEVALALLKKDGFEKITDGQGNLTYTAEISYPIDRQHLLIHYEAWQKQAGSFGFHYTPYNFDSNPEKNFFEILLEMLKQQPEQVKDIYFTGALTDTKKTDFFIEYRGMDGRMHNYTPDFVIRRKDGKRLIVEIKSERERTNEIDGEHGAKAIATRAWANLNPDSLKYEMIFTSADELGYGQLQAAQAFIEGQADEH